MKKLLFLIIILAIVLFLSGSETYSSFSIVEQSKACFHAGFWENFDNPEQEVGEEEIFEEDFNE